MEDHDVTPAVAVETRRELVDEQVLTVGEGLVHGLALDAVCLDHERLDDPVQGEGEDDRDRDLDQPAETLGALGLLLWLWPLVGRWRLDGRVWLVGRLGSHRASG